MKTPFRYLAKMGSREVKSNWAQFLSIVAIGGIAVTLFVGLLANAESFEKRVDETYSSGNLADLWVTTDGYRGKDQALIEKTVGEGCSVEGRFEMNASLYGHSVYTAIENGMPEINKPSEILSTSESNSDSDHFLIDTAFADGVDRNFFGLGKPMPVIIDISSYDLSQYADKMAEYVLPGGTNLLSETSWTLDFTATGFMKHPENVTRANYNTSTVLIGSQTFKRSLDALLAKNYTPEGIKKVYEGFLVELNWGDGTPESDLDLLPAPNQYLVTVSDKTRVSGLKSSIEEAFAGKSVNNLLLVTTRDSMPFAITMQNDVKQARNFTFVFPFVFFAVAILVILTTTSQIILKERTQIGTLKALGLSQAQIYGHYIGLTLAVVGIGTLIGEILGPILIPFILGQKYDILYSLPARTYVFPTFYGLLTAFLFLFVAALTTFLVCHKEVRLKPAESMRPAIPSLKVRGESRVNLKGTKGLSAKMAFRNIKLDPVKSLMVVIGVLGCTALLVCGYGIEDTVYYGIDHDLALAENAQVTLTFGSAQKKARLEHDLLAFDDVASFEGYSKSASTACLAGGGPQSDTAVYLLSNTTDSHFKVDFPLEEVAISEKVAGEIGAKEGDTVSFTYGSSTYTSTVGAVYTAFVFNGVLVHADSHILGAGEPSFLGAWVDVKEGVDPTQVKAEALTLTYVSEADTQQDWRNQINDVMSGVLIMTNAVKIFAILLAVVVLYNLALLNFRQRIRDIATLKVLGFSKLEIAESLLWETMSLTFAGVVVGLLLGFPFLYLVLYENRVDLVMYLYTIYPLTYVYAFLLTFVVAYAVNALFSFRSGKVKMVESLKSVE